MFKRASLLLLLTSLAGTGILAAQAQQSSSPATTPPAKSTAAPSDGTTHARHSFTSEDRAAFLDGRLAAIKAGLRLTPEQERLWPPVESAARDMMRLNTDIRAERDASAPTDPIGRMARMGDAWSKRGAAMTRLADAANPLYASLSEDQKKRLRVLIRGADTGMMMSHGGQGAGYGHGRHHDHMAQGAHRRHHEGSDNFDRGHHDRRGSWNDWQ